MSMRTFEKELNPLHSRVPELSDFSNVTPQTQTEKEEYPHLQKVTQLTKTVVQRQIKILKDLEVDLEDQIKVIALETGDDKASAVSIYNKILKEIQKTVVRINKELITFDTPYFGKILFKTKVSRQEKDLPVYIGKFAMVDPETYLPLISDWRAPIANLYYENSGPKENVQYTSPIGVRRGDLLQKRQFDISEARIRNIYDAKTGNVAADEFLLSQLNQRLGQKLKDIVATIQSQQNDIIREEINKPVIIQGVAGSGKTTILLHRLAYLFFAHKESITPERTLVIAPNKMFLDYISDVLPSLGIQGVETNTYMFWAKNILGWDEKYVLYHKEENLEYKEYKGSLEFIKVIDRYFEDFEEELLDNIPYSRKDLIRNRYYELKTTYPYITMIERLELATEFALAQKQFRNQTAGYFMDSYEKDLEKRKEIKKYFVNKSKIVDIYRQLFTKDYLGKNISKYTLEGINRSSKNKTFRMEDLAPITYLHLKIHGSKEHEKEYVVADEAQDLSLVQILTLLQIAKNRNITIAGDLAQSIIPPFYIKDWNQAIKLFDKWNIQNYSYHQLNRCYRTTVEIIEFANKIFKNRFPESYKLPEAVLRHGEPIRRIKCKPILEMEDRELDDLMKEIKSQFEKGSVTCALICRNKEHARVIHQRIEKYQTFLERDIVDYSRSDYKTGLLILPVEDAKGLEFDTVIIVDINDVNYPEAELSTRLMYVAITRALHRLILLENSNSSPLLVE